MTNKIENKKVKPLDWILLILAIVYTVSPIDIISDIIPIAGWLDDFTALATTVLNIIQKGFAETNTLFSTIAKTLKWIILLLGAILVVIILLFGTLIYKLIS
jgi:uncharacterized membrane protein YkvA (DUF1232 family)